MTEPTVATRLLRKFVFDKFDRGQGPAWTTNFRHDPKFEVLLENEKLRESRVVSSNWNNGFIARCQFDSARDSLDYGQLEKSW